ncbi:MAG: hypothetical protein PSV22_02125 [Pseudolabrys sp.]|nr:hypothetical protein [Pseudolabrys sp.]
MTFSNRREPSFDGVQGNSGGHGSIHDPAHSLSHGGPHLGTGEAAAHQGPRASGFSRAVSTVQIVGSLLAVPLGLASGYSMYKANFAPDTTCQNLRAGIIAMLDKNVDAATRRMLVRRDVSTFEETCASFDPDAHAAFKVLLASPTPGASAAAPKLRAALPANEVARKAEPKPEPKAAPKAKVEAKSEPKPDAKLEAKAETKSEPRQAVAEKTPVVVPAPASIEAIEHEAALSDTRWLAAVRQALVTHGPAAASDEPAPAEAAKLEQTKLEQTKIEPSKIEPNLDAVLAKPARNETPGVAKSATLPPASPAAPPVQLQPAWNVPAPVVAGTPAVEPPARATPMQDDHPVPPAAIPGATLEPTPVNSEAKPAAESRFGSWIAQIPLVGRVIEPRGN